MSQDNKSVAKFKEEIILELVEFQKLDVVETDIINQVKNGKFDDEIEELEVYASVTDATDSILDSYKISNTK